MKETRIIIYAISFLILLNISYAAYPHLENLKGWWAMNESSSECKADATVSSIIDYSPDGYNNRMNSSYCKSFTRLNGTAMIFNNSYNDGYRLWRVNDHATFEPLANTNNYTLVVVASIQSNVTTAVGVLAYIKDNNGAPILGLGTSSSTHNLTIAVSGGGGATTNVGFIPDFNQKYMFTQVWNNSRCRTYVNKTLVDDRACSYTPNTVMNDFLVSTDGNSGSNATIYTVLLYINATMTATDIEQIYNVTFGITSGGSEPIAGPPDIPTNLLNASQNNESVYLTWTAAAGAEKYMLWGGDGINWYNSTNAYYNWTSLNQTSGYCFNVSSYNSTMTNTQSNRSNTICTTTHKSPYAAWPAIFDTEMNITEILLGNKVMFTVNVTHTSYPIDKVVAELTYPNGSKVNYTMTRKT